MNESERSRRADRLALAAALRSEPCGGGEPDLRLQSAGPETQKSGVAPRAAKPSAPAVKLPLPPRREHAKAAGARERGRTFGQIIRERRRQLDLTQEDVARQIRTSVPYIGHLEADSRHPSETIVARMADALGLDRSELFFLANPEAKALLQQKRSEEQSPWQQFLKDERLQRAYGVTQKEMEMLSQVALMGEVRSVRDFIYILTSVRQALTK
jgi:transcriptional regulator with XRE-family HTH domain